VGTDCVVNKNSDCRSKWEADNGDTGIEGFTQNVKEITLFPDLPNELRSVAFLGLSLLLLLRGPSHVE